jgi:hypothetical protein
VAERLEQECGLPSAPMALTPMVHNIENQELSESEIAKIFETAFSSLKSYYERLIAVPPKVDCPKLGYVELVVIDRGEERRRNKAQISDFLQTTMQGIDAVLKRLGSINYDEILKFDDEFDVPPTGRRIVISGAPGCGKSTLSRHLCKDLSTGHLSNTYQLIVLVELRELAYRLQEGEQLQLKHMLNKYRFLQNKEVGDAIYKCRGRNILLILDGYDELDESLRSCQFLKLILPACSPTYLNECDVIVTTRPVTCGELFNMVGNPHRHIEILGFKREHIYEYIDKYFVKLPLEQPSCQKLKAKLQQLPHVEGMCRVPVVLEIVCKVYRILGECSIPETQTGIYQEYIISELIESKDGQKVKVADLLSVSEEDFPGFSKLCEKAFECCSKKEQRLLLTEQDVGSLKDYVKRGSMYGLLFAEAIDSICEGGNVCIYYFLHKSIQEMLAAVHIGKLPEGEHEALWTEQFGRPEMAEIWKYYAGITSLKKLNTSFIQEMCSKNSKKDDQKMLLAISLFEASNKDVAAKILPQIFPNGCISAKAGSSYEITVLNYCVRNHPSVTSVKLAGNRSIKFGEPLKDLMSALCSLQHLDLSLLSQEDWKILYASILPGNRITSVSLGQVPVEVLTKIVSECNCLEKLTIKGMIKANMRKGFAAEVCKVISGSGSLNCVKFILSKSCKMSDTEIQGVVSAIVSGLIGATQTSSSVSKAVGPPLEKNTACKAKMVEVLHSCTRRETFLQCCTGGDEYKFVAPIVQAVLKGLPSYNKQQTVMIRCVTCYNQESINGDESWISSQPELVVPGIKCRLELCLTPEEWYAILCGVVDLEDLEELDLTMWMSNVSCDMLLRCCLLKIYMLSSKTL